MRAYDLHGVHVLELGADGPALGRPQDASDLVGDAMGHDASFIVIPAARLEPDFFRLRSGLAGEMLQKFVNYGLRIAVVGDISTLVSSSTALRDFVLESKRGNAVWFLPDMGELERRLAAQANGSTR